MAKEEKKAVPDDKGKGKITESDGADGSKKVDEPKVDKDGKVVNGKKDEEPKEGTRAYGRIPAVDTNNTAMESSLLTAISI